MGRARCRHRAEGRSAAIDAVGERDGLLYGSILEHGTGTDWLTPALERLTEGNPYVIVDERSAAAWLPKIQAVAGTDRSGSTSRSRRMSRLSSEGGSGEVAPDRGRICTQHPFGPYILRRFPLKRIIPFLLVLGLLLPNAALAASSTTTTRPVAVTAAFAKTKFVFDLGTAAFAIHHFIYAPYQEEPHQGFFR